MIARRRGPHPPVAQTATVVDLERSESLRVRLRHDQRPLVGCERDPVRKCEVVGHKTRDSVAADDCERPRFEVTSRKIEPDVVHVCVAGAVDDDVVPRPGGQTTEISVRRERPVRLVRHQPGIAPSDKQQPAVGREIDAHRE
jgi:hypothetical protein